MAGGTGREAVQYFYTNHLVDNFFPPDVNMTTVSRSTVEYDQVVEELVVSLTHTTFIDWLLPGISPTGKKVEIAFTVIVGFKDGKISHEHIYWNQASVLVQVGPINAKGLPVCGAEMQEKYLIRQYRHASTTNHSFYFLSGAFESSRLKSLFIC